jgi:hypothetical protein
MVNVVFGMMHTYGKCVDHILIEEVEQALLNGCGDVMDAHNCCVLGDVALDEGVVLLLA